MNKKIFLLSLFLFIFSFVSALTWENSDTLAGVVATVDDRDVFIVLLGTLDEEGVDLRDDFELSTSIKEKAVEFGVNINDYPNVQLHTSMFRKISWNFSNYITGFASKSSYEDTKKQQKGREGKEGEGKEGEGKDVAEESKWDQTQENTWNTVLIDEQIIDELDNDEAFINGEGEIFTGNGDTINPGEVVELLEQLGIRTNLDTLVETLKREEVLSALRDELGLTNIQVSKEKKMGKAILSILCKDSNVWRVIYANGKIIRSLSLQEKCEYGCEKGGCIKKEEVVEENSEEKTERKKKESIEEKSKPVPGPLSVEKISKNLEGIISTMCVPSCEDEERCGGLDGCGDFCSNEDIDTPNKCGNPSLLPKKPENAKQTFDITTSKVAEGTQEILSWILGIS